MTVESKAKRYYWILVFILPSSKFHMVREKKTKFRLREIVVECMLALRRQMMFYITNEILMPSWTRLAPQTDLPS